MSDLRNEKPLGEVIDGVSEIDLFASLNRLLEENPEFKRTYDSVMSILGDGPTAEEVTEVKCVEIDGHDYIVAKRIEIAGNTYLYLVNENDILDFIIQKVIIEDGKKYIIGLDSDKEFDLVQTYIQRDFLIGLKEKLKKSNKEAPDDQRSITSPGDFQREFTFKGKGTKPERLSFMQDIKTILESISADSSVMDIDRDGFCLASQLFDIAEADTKSDACRQAIDTFEKICKVNRNVPNLPAMFSGRLTSIGMSAYSAKNYPVAETAFRLLAESGDTSAKNNYAYIIRRHEITEVTETDYLRALKILHEGMRNGDAFSMVNTALVFALMLGDNESWHLADSIMQKLSNFGGMLVESWWENVAKQGDNEGYLVHFFLLKYEKIEKSALGSLKSITTRLKNSIEGFPDWLADDCTFDSLEEIMKYTDDPDFNSYLEEFLKNMPYSRESVNEMLETITGWDLWPIYNKLLTEYESLLTTEEITKLRSDYKEKFDIPLPDEVE